GKLELEEEPFDLRQTVWETVELLVTKAVDKELDLLCQIDTALPDVVLGDVTRFRQILLNLIGNALKFTYNGAVAIQVKVIGLAFDRCTVQVSVRDTGIGIPAHRLDSLFESFSQADASITREFGGTGLGLAISKRLVEMMGGRIWVESVVHQGSTFTFETPLAVVQPSTFSYLSKAHADFADREILLIANEGDSAAQIEALLTTWGAAQILRSNGETALLNLTGMGHFNLIIVDTWQLELDVALLTALQQHHHTPIVVVGNLNRKLDHIDMDHVGFLRRPIKPANLFETIVALINQNDISKPAPMLNPAQKAQTVHGSEKPLRILLVEDNAVNRKVATRMLQRFGYSAIHAENGAQAISILQEHPFDLVFMDVQMPVMDGITATTIIRAELAPERQPYIVAMTANALKGDRERCLTAGMNAYISKPVRLPELEQVLTNTPTLEIPELDDDIGDSAGEFSMMPHNDTTSPINFAELEEMIGEDAFDLLAELAEIFIEQAQDQISELRVAINEDDAGRVREWAHSLKGSSASIAATQLSTSCASLEMDARNGDLSQAHARLHQIESEYARVQNALQPHLP
ncbi:MAG: response regulator, partial [Anaerolineales bacterium]|nr:response regulator [Anaerolineales bacterium]